MKISKSTHHFFTLSYLVVLSISLLTQGCSGSEEYTNSNDEEEKTTISIDENVLDYSRTPTNPYDRNPLVFSDQGAWMGFGFSDQDSLAAGFSGPFLMTQENGRWISPSLIQFSAKDESGKSIQFNSSDNRQKSYLSHLEQSSKNDDLELKQQLVFSSPHSVIISSTLSNNKNEAITLSPSFHGTIWPNSFQLTQFQNQIRIESDQSKAIGILSLLSEESSEININDSSYTFSANSFILQPQGEKEFLFACTFIFPEYDLNEELNLLEHRANDFQALLGDRKAEKSQLLNGLVSNMDSSWTDTIYQKLLAKTVQTLQNNWRVPAGEVTYAGLFPSYNYIWFNGFWAWDSWKHAVALSHYNVELAKDQIRLMYDYQTENGFIPDCIYRDTSIEKHNYRNTKPPLSAWAVWEVYLRDHDLDFIEEMYQKIKLQHKWWYVNRDYDKDGLCEYGSEDGTLVAAKWESGMDNAVRFDESSILKSAEGVYSLDQESVDLNAYLYAEKVYLKKMAEVIELEDDAQQFSNEAETLKDQIQSTFFNEKTGWFYDVSIDGKEFVMVEGCEGWIPLWANCATPEQAESIKDKMMAEDHFNTHVPLPTLSANHEKFKPDGGYWRGPNWLDQCHFGVKGLHQYGFHEEANELAYKLFHNAAGILKQGIPIRENYNPMTGAGLESKNFSWSAAHYLLLLLGE
ncbi:MAG: trehalase [Flavobacteriales bacterium]|nr:trehalase [Flavobacteriales bacterium]